MSSDFQLSECTVADVPDLIEVYLAAFENDPVGQYTIPKTIPHSELHHWLTHRFTKIFLHRREMRITKIVHLATGRMAAFLRYAYPHTLTPSEITERKLEEYFKAEELAQGRHPSWPVGANIVLCEKMFGEMGRRQAKVVDDEEWYVAHLLGTHPDFQRKGCAKMLLGDMLAKADLERRKAYIEATVMGLPVYRKLGFKEFDVVEVDVSPWGGVAMVRNVLMVREPILGEKVG